LELDDIQVNCEVKESSGNSASFDCDDGSGYVPLKVDIDSANIAGVPDDATVEKNPNPDYSKKETLKLLCLPALLFFLLSCSNKTPSEPKSDDNVPNETPEEKDDKDDGPKEDVDPDIDDDPKEELLNDVVESKKVARKFGRF